MNLTLSSFCLLYLICGICFLFIIYRKNSNHLLVLNSDSDAVFSVVASILLWPLQGAITVGAFVYYLLKSNR